MDVIDNISKLLGDDLKGSIRQGSTLSIAASTFSIYAYEALKTELESLESLSFVFTKPTFVANEVTDRTDRQPASSSSRMQVQNPASLARNLRSISRTS